MMFLVDVVFKCSGATGSMGISETRTYMLVHAEDQTAALVKIRDYYVKKSDEVFDYTVTNVTFCPVIV